MWIINWRKESLSKRTEQPLGLLIPTLLEGDRVINCLENAEKEQIQGKFFYKGYIKGVPVVIVICGIGKANAAHAAGILVYRYSPSVFINIGIAGAYPSSGLNIGDLAVADREIYTDEGLITARGDFVSVESLGLPLAVYQERLYFNAYDTFIPSFLRGNLREGTFVTLSTCTGSLQKACLLEGQYGCICENMEGAAIAQVAAYCNLPFFELRSVSNIIRERNEKGIDREDLLMASRAAQSYILSVISEPWLI